MDLSTTIETIVSDIVIIQDNPDYIYYVNNIKYTTADIKKIYLTGKWCYNSGDCLKQFDIPINTDTIYYMKSMPYYYNIFMISCNSIHIYHIAKYILEHNSRTYIDFIIINKSSCFHPRYHIIFTLNTP
jgi:hypothetical protein